MKYTAIQAMILGVVFLLSCSGDTTDLSSNSEPPNEQSHNNIQVLNFGTFHMGFTTDANTTEFDEEDKKNQQRVHAVAEKLSDFNPTVILVEREPEDNEEIQKEYNKYINNPDMVFENPSEIELLAYELGRLSGTERIYGIDHKMEYNYRIGHEIDNFYSSDT